MKEVLRQIEIDVLTNKVPNLKDELLKWVKRMSKYSQDVIRMLYMHQSEYISDNILLIS